MSRLLLLFFKLTAAVSTGSKSQQRAANSVGSLTSTKEADSGIFFK